MGIFNFIKEAGQRIGLGKDEPAPDTNDEAADLRKSKALQRLVSGKDLPIRDLRIEFRDGLATVHGTAETQAAREHVILFVGNIRGVEKVDDRTEVETPEPQARFYTVKSGDTLSAIAKRFFGDAARYPEIFEANTPMLENPDLIYTGQVLRIPPQG